MQPGDPGIWGWLQLCPFPEVLENGEFLEMGLKGLAHEGNDGNIKD